MLRTRFATLLLALPLLGACAMTFDATRVGVPVTMASADVAPAEGAAFKVRSSAVYALWGAVRLKEPSLAKALETQLVGAKEVRDLRIKVRSNPLQVLVSVVTLGVFVPRTVEYSGVIPGASGAPAAAPK